MWSDSSRCNGQLNSMWGWIGPPRETLQIGLFLAFPEYFHSRLHKYLTRLFPFSLAKGKPSTDRAPAARLSRKDTLRRSAPTLQRSGRHSLPANLAMLPAHWSEAGHLVEPSPQASGERPAGAGGDPEQSCRVSFSDCKHVPVVSSCTWRGQGYVSKRPATDFWVLERMSRAAVWAALSKVCSILWRSRKERMAIQGKGTVRFHLALPGQGLGPPIMHPSFAHTQRDRKEPKLQTP